ncbi:MAG: chemotaxis protein CheW [Planctomycetia bacterium]
MPDSTPAAAIRACTFRVGGDCFAIDAEHVTEVIREGHLAHVPLAPEGVLGLVHLRGRIVPIIDLAGRLGIARAAARGTGTHLIVEAEADRYGLRVDEMLDTIDIPADRIEHPTDAARSHEAVIGVFAAAERLVHLLDPDRMIQSLVRPRTTTPARHGAPHGGPR